MPPIKEYLAIALAIGALPAAAPLRASPIIENLALNGSATASSEGYASVAADLIDGNRDGHFHNSGSVWHSAPGDTILFVEVDLGAMYYLDRAMAWPRTDVLQGTFENVRLTVFDSGGAAVWTRDFLPANAAANPWGTSALRGVRGQRVRLEKIDADPDFLTFAELEIWGSATPVPDNLALSKPAATSGDRFDTPAAHGNDGDLGGDYAIVGRPIWHSDSTGVGKFWEADLGADEVIDYLIYYNRTDHTNTASGRLTIRDEGGATVYDTDLAVARETLVNGGRQFDITHDVPGTVTGRYVRIETVIDTYLSFTELEVFGSPYDPEPPAVEWASPGDGAFARELRSVEVIFSEPVSGVAAGDLLVNGEPATAMRPVTDRYYIFAFDPAAEGAAAIAFAANNQIVDRFGNALPATAWSVTIDPALPAPRLAITEFLASNKGGLEDADGDSPDWIEITNIGAVTANLGGWFLTDDAADLTRWRLPATTLAPGESLIVFASDKDRAFPGQELHANFKLDADGGYLALVWPDGAAVASEWTYGEQETNISTGTGQRFRETPLVAADAASRFVIPAGEIPGWAAVGFDDAAWQGGTAALGYEAADAPGGFGPLAWFDFNDATDPAVAADRSGNGNGGLIRNATYTADGGGRTGNAGDRALDFPGNGSVDLATAALGAFDAIERANGITLTLWCYGAAQQPAANYIFMARPEIGSSFRALDAHLPWSDSTIYFDSGGCCDLGLHRIFINDPDPQNWRGAWNHYAFVKDGDLKQIWQNGVLLTDGENSAPLTVFREFYLGAENAAGTVGYRGTIDDFAMFDGALDAAAIEAIAAGASPLGARSAAAYFDTDLGAMRGANASAFVRIPFAIDDPSAHALLSLRMQYSDGFAAYLNGTEVARRNAPAGDLAFDGSALGSRPASAAFAAEAIDLSGFSDLLVSGQNVLAFHGLNAAAGDGGFLLRAELFSGARLDGRLMVPPTPGAPNASGVTGFVADTKFAPDRGFYEEPVEVTITCATPGAMIAYTTDGSEPTPDNGTQGASPLAVTVAATTPLRARAFDPAGELGPTNVDTHTYLFLDGVAAQAKPDSAPDLWPGNHPADFTMDARVAENALPGYSLREALEDLPSLMVTAPPADLWGANGIYRNSGGRGKNWERAASGEWLDPQGGPGFQVEFGLRIHGNISRNKGFTPKHGFKMYLRERYGDASLKFPLFPDSPADEFTLITLRAGSTDTFPVTEWDPVPLGLNRELYQRWARPWASYVRDQWARDAQVAMGQPGSHGRFCHLYLNGIYWGIYNACELPDENFAANYFGGEPDDYDAVADWAELKAGTMEYWTQMIGMASQGFADDANVQRALGNHPDGTPNPDFPPLIDLDNLIDYFILHIFIGADDWPAHNWWATRRSRGDLGQTPWRFFTWDQEISNENVLYQRMSGGSVIYAEVNNASTVAHPYAALRQNAEFRTRFGDRVHRHLFNGGALSEEANLARWNARLTEIDKAIVAESARWGDYRRPAQPHTREGDWLPHLDWMAQNYWPQINGVALQRYRDAGLYPALAAPAITPFGSGAGYGPGFSFSMANPNTGGAILYSLDGTDPRQAGGAPHPSALTYGGESVALDFASGGAALKARVFDSGSGEWSALADAAFAPRRDFDQDGIDSDWELLHQLDPEDPGDAAVDGDFDGRSAAEEFAADTDPRDPASRFEITQTTVRADGSVHLIWTSSPRRVYDILGAESPAGPWVVQQSGIAGEEAGATTSEGVQPPPELRFFTVRARIP